ncbi:hypothetical protein N9K47_00110 [bacterium]|nr:hypothetical protein [bacterium]
MELAQELFHLVYFAAAFFSETHSVEPMLSASVVRQVTGFERLKEKKESRVAV